MMMVVDGRKGVTDEMFSNRKVSYAHQFSSILLG
jgi:hypothetical protein